MVNITYIQTLLFGFQLHIGATEKQTELKLKIVKIQTTLTKTKKMKRVMPTTTKLPTEISKKKTAYSRNKFTPSNKKSSIDQLIATTDHSHKFLLMQTLFYLYSSW